MIEKLMVLFFLVVVWTGVFAAETYRWEDADGNVHYSDTLPPAGARNVRRTTAGGGDVADTSQLPYELREAVSNAPVTLYVTECGDPCDMARALLVKRGVPHTLLDANQPDVREALKALPNGRLEVPVAEVGSVVLWGFEVNQWHAALDRAGYPSEALITVTPYVPREQSAEAANAESDNEDADDFDTEDVDSEGVDSDFADDDYDDTEYDDEDDFGEEDEEAEFEDDGEDEDGQ